jgi:hypothetical protein
VRTRGDSLPDQGDRPYAGACSEMCEKHVADLVQVDLSARSFSSVRRAV